jgi:hypothetical protein
VAIVAKFIGPRDADGAPLGYHGGIQAVDHDEEMWAALTDEQKATLAASPLYELRREAPKEAAAAERRVERAEATEAPPVAPRAEEGKKG